MVSVANGTPLKRILVVDDDARIAASIRRALAYEGYEVEVAGDGPSALNLARTTLPDLIVLDVMLPGIDGMDVCRRLRRETDILILMLTALDATADRVQGLDTGADDYLTKPFAYEELLARVRALLRRKEPTPVRSIVFADLAIDPGTREVFRDQRPISLTALEFDLLHYLLLHPRQVLSRERLLDSVWGDDAAVTQNAVDVYIGYLRQKLEVDGGTAFDPNRARCRVCASRTNRDLTVPRRPHPSRWFRRRRSAKPLKPTTPKLKQQRHWREVSIRARIAIFGGLTIACILLVFGGALYLIAANSAVTDQKSLLRERAQAALAAIAIAPDSDFAPHTVLTPLDLREISKTDNREAFTAVYDQLGNVLVSNGLIDGQPPAINVDAIATAVANGSLLTSLNASGIPLTVYIVPWSRPDLGREGIVVTGQTKKQVQRQILGFRLLLILTSLFMIVGAFIPTWRVAGRALRPLRTIAETVDEIGQTQDLSRRLPALRTGDDLARLSVNFNRMLERLEEAQAQLASALETQRRFIADASHELRTPLTTIRSNAGFLLARPDVRPDDREAALTDIASESERMSRLVNDLLLLARADAGYQPPMEPLDLVEVLRDCWRQAQRLHTSRDLVMQLPAPPQRVEVRGNRDLLTQLCWIVIDNAVKHTLRGGKITSALAVDLEHGRAELTISDDGTGIPEADLPRIFDRFYQSDRARSSQGAGLGLSIAHWIVVDHGGQIAATNNPTGGAQILISFPLLDAS